MDDLTFIEGVLGRAGASIAYPATPELGARVMRSISVAAPTTRRGRGLAFAGAAAVLVAGVAATVAVPSSREAVADFFGIEGSDVRVAPTPPSGVTPTPLPTPHDIDASAAPASLAQIEAAIGRPVALPRGEEPTASLLVRYGASPAAILRYDGYDVWQIDAGGDFEGIVGKVVTSDAQITDVSVGGRPARWISGGPHLVEYIDALGQVDEGSLRTVERNTLIWRTEAALYRIETDLALADALALAETLP